MLHLWTTGIQQSFYQRAMGTTSQGKTRRWIDRGVAAVRRALADSLGAGDEFGADGHASATDPHDESASRALIAGMLVFHAKKVRDVMRPRTDIVALTEDASTDEVWSVVRAERYSRYPVYKESLDDVVGIFLAKDLWLHDGSKPFGLRDVIRPALYVPDNRAAERVLDDLRKKRAHMAVVLDEYGGTAGIVTLEDLIEEVIGDINDEYDFAVRRAVEANGVLELAGTLSLVDVRADHDVDIPEGDWNTLGGFVFGALGRVPRMGDRVHFPGGELEVVAMDGRRVAALRVVRSEAPRGERPALGDTAHARAEGGSTA
jgi:CBS domain containing-hemolysin-like protein